MKAIKIDDTISKLMANCMKIWSNLKFKIDDLDKHNLNNNVKISKISKTPNEYCLSIVEHTCKTTIYIIYIFVLFAKTIYLDNSNPNIIVTKLEELKK